MTKPADDLTCREMVDFMADYLEGTLDRRTRAVFDAHLHVCPDCVAYLGSFAETMRLARECRGDDPVPADVPGDLVRAILAARPSRRS
jgi:predicted anti-sigma-YlaC factor YlaD